MFALIDRLREQKQHKVNRLCRVFGVNRSSYHDPLLRKNTIDAERLRLRATVFAAWLEKNRHKVGFLLTYFHCIVPLRDI